MNRVENQKYIQIIRKSSNNVAIIFVDLKTLVANNFGND